MFTVVIAEKAHLDAIQEYRLFLKPFLNTSCVAFCPWYPTEDTLEHTVPDLLETVSNQKQWRAVIVSEQGLTQKNPFDVVPYTAPVRTPEQTLEEHLKQVQKAKFAAYAQAARQPLVRLTAHFCQMPLISDGKNRLAEEDAEFWEYQQEAQYKQALWKEIVGDKPLEIAQPTQILCLARRTYQTEAYDIGTAWTPHMELQYSNFADWNLYFDKLRYLVFDILPQEHVGYGADYLRFLYVLLVLANNGAPSDCLRTERVYCLECQNDEAALSRLLSAYDGKLQHTAELLKKEIDRLELQPRERLSDRDANTIFCSRVSVPVQPSSEFERSGLFADWRSYGLSGDCSMDERGRWLGQYAQADKTLHELLKQPRRALAKATDSIRDMNQADVRHADRLNTYQKEDIQEHTDKEELKMVSMEIAGVEDVDRYHAWMVESDKAIRRKIATRMSKKTTIVVGVVALALFLVGFLPFIVSSVNDAFTGVFALLTTLICLVLLALIGFACLFFLRYGLTRLVRRFNGVMFDIETELSKLMALFSEYLSHACNVMRGYSVLNYCADKEEPKTRTIRVLKKHVADIEQARADIRTVFSTISELETPEPLPDPFDYDYTRPVDYQYPIPYTEGMQREIEYLQAGKTVRVPVDFIRRITARREELYD